MTTEEFNARYKLLKQIAQGTGRSFTAQEAATGRAVLVHFLDDDLGGQVTEMLGRLASRDRSKVLDTLRVGQSAVVITQFLEDFESFDLWLRSRAGDRRPAAPPPEAPARSGDFTKLFEPGSSPQPERPPAVPAPRPPRDSFTELFETPPEPMARARPPSTPPPVEILRVRIPASDPAPPPAPAPALPMPSWPGSFEPPKASAPLPPLPSPMLGSQAPPPIAAAPVIRTPALDSPPPPAPVAGWSGASDYTRQLSPAPAPIDAPPAAASPPPRLDAASGAKETPAGASHSIVPLLLVLNIVVIIATGVIVYFALKKS